MKDATKHLMDILKAKLLQILTLIPSESKIYYLDYPVHGNIGDLLILKGTERFFKDNGIKVSARYSYYNFPEGLNIPKDYIIVFHGGGNLGDLYLPHQEFREKVISTHPKNKIIILPQTVYFKDKNKKQKARSIFSRHKNLHICARDKPSINRLKGFKNQIYLVPDMAHQLWPIFSNTSCCKKKLYLMRRDKEKKHTLSIASNQDVFDWATLLNKNDHEIIKKIIQDHKDSVITGNHSTVQTSWYQQIEKLIDKAIALFSLYEEITTSRLHGHILASLMGKRNILLDNSYGKNYGYYQTWTHALKESTFYEDSN